MRGRFSPERRTIMKIWKSSHPYAIITILCWSLAYIFTRIAIRYFSAFSLGFLRYLAAAAVLLILAVAYKIKAPEKGDLKWFLLSGLSGFFLYVILFNKGTETVPASAGSMILALVPVITAILAKFIYQERIKLFQYVSIALEFAGVIIVTGVYELSSINAGFIWLLGAAFSLSSYNIVQRKLTKKYTPLRATIYSIFIGTILLCVFLPGSLGEIRNAPKIQFIYILILGVFSSAIAYFTWAKAMSIAKETATVSNYMFLTPILTSILGFITINERPNKKTIIGGSIILLGMLIYNFGGRVTNMVKKPA
jgi:drug/metabolite transporter (DMT)-like permease